MSYCDDIDSTDYNDTNMGAGANYDSPEEKQIARLEKMVADLRAQLAACAAGPWRTDVENAPREVWLMGWFDLYWDKVRRFDHGDIEWVDFANRPHRAPLAFAIPNPPQVASAKPKEKL